MFCVCNTNENSNVNKNIINANDYLDKKDLAQNKNPTNQKDLNIEPLNLNFSEFLENLFADAYESDKLVRIIIDAKVKRL